MAQLSVRALRDHDGEPLSLDRVYVRGVTQSVAYTGTSARTANNFTAGCAFVELFATTNAHYKLGGGSVAATTSDIFIPANTRLIVATMGQSRIAAIQNATGGSLFVTELGNAT